jgi:uncharacterized phage-associated protein
MSSSSPYDARAVANLLLELAQVQRLPLTQVSILKLLYFAHGWYLAIHRRPLISQEFEAWKYGPVVKVVRDAFRNYEAAPIAERATKLDILTSARTVVAPDISSDDATFIRAIFDAYHLYDAWELSDMTHEPGSPWDQIWNSNGPIGRLALRIRNEDIQHYFDRLPRRFPIS